MGDPRKSRKKWIGPKHPWIKERLMKELELMGRYGLRNKRELWKAHTMARRFRHQARSLLALPDEIREVEEKKLIERLAKLGLVPENAKLDNVLGLTEEHILERRLQTIVYRKGLASTIHQARQYIVHGHIAIKGRRVTSPGYLVDVEEEKYIEYTPGSPIAQRIASQEEV